MNSLFLPLYIDPGTGSMLFSILIGATATLYFVARAAVLKIKLVLSGKKGDAVDASYKPYVVYCEDKRYYNVFKPIADEFESRKQPLVYYVARKDDPIFEQKYQYVKAECIGEGNSAFAKLNLMSAGIIIMTTPGLQVYQMKRSKNVKHYCHIMHSTTDATMYRLFGLDYFDSVLLTGDYERDQIRKLESQRKLPEKELVTVGCTYLDEFAKKIAAVPEEDNHPFTVLVSPSWGKNALLTRYGEKLLDPLIATGFRIIIRPHPQSKISEPDMLNHLTEKYKDVKNIEWDYNRDNIYSLKKADVMISDFSGIIFDYTFLCDKPVIYVNADMDLIQYDAYDLKEPLWEVTALHKFGIELKEEHFADIKNVLKSASDSPELAAARHAAKDEAWMCRGEAGKRTADFMIQTVERLASKANNEQETKK